MTIKYQTEPNCSVVFTDQANLTDDEVRDLLAAIKNRTDTMPLVLDLEHVKAIDSDAMRILVLVAGATANQEARLPLVATKAVRDLFSKEQLDHLFTYYNSLKEAIEATTPGVVGEDALDFLNVTRESVFDTLLLITKIKAMAGKLVKDKKLDPPIDISGTVGVFGKSFSGTLVLSFPTKTFLAIMSKWLNKNFTQISPDIQDGAAEVVNVLMGQVKRALTKRGYMIRHAIPTVVKGQDLQFMHTPNTLSAMVIPFTTEVGDFYLQLAVRSSSEQQ